MRDGSPTKRPQAVVSGPAAEPGSVVTLLDYGAGNVQSVRNAIATLGFEVRSVRSPDDIASATRMVFPGVGDFGSCVAALRGLGYFQPLQRYLQEDRPFLGICLGMQTLFEASEESPGVAGLGLLPGTVARFPRDLGLAVPHIGWSGVAPLQADPWPLAANPSRCYFVHSYRVALPAADAPWALACCDYGERFVCAVRRGRCIATQFHPEKSGSAGLELLRQWLSGPGVSAAREALVAAPLKPAPRIIACLDVRSNDDGDLVVTKGDQYDCREQSTTDKGQVRNLGKPVALAERYYREGADEVTFLNITAFREVVLADQPMLEVLRGAAERVFVPLTVGGGIRAYVDKEGKSYTSLEIADAYFRAGADKISIGSDAVEVARAFHAEGRRKTGATSIETISAKYGRQAVVISVDPRRFYVPDPAATAHACVELGKPGGTPKGPAGERFAWYCCTLRGGREDSDVDVVQLVQAMEELGAGEILLNCIDRDGQNSGYELELVRQVKAACSLPVIASSGAGCPEHFAAVLSPPEADGSGGGGADAALAAGIFHRREVAIEAVKEHLAGVAGIPVRL